MRAVARGARSVALWLGLLGPAGLSGCGHGPPAPRVVEVPPRVGPSEATDVPSGMHLRVHHHWAACREGVSGEARVSLDDRTLRVPPGEALVLPLPAGSHALVAEWQAPEGLRAHAERLEVSGDTPPRELHLGCSPQTLAMRPLVPLVLLPDGPRGFAGPVTLGGVTLEVPRDGRLAVFLPRGGHRLALAAPIPGCADASTTLLLDGAGRVVHLGPCGEARAVPLQTRAARCPSEGASNASGDCAFEAGSVGSAP